LGAFVATHLTVGKTKVAGNRKDRDIGYVLAANSCEGVNNVETCTIAVLDVITAFAVPNPSFSSQRLPVFSGLAALRVAPPDYITQPTSDWQLFIEANPFSRRRD
jgi:hypothetical protein